MLKGTLAAPSSLSGRLDGGAGLAGSLMTGGRFYPAYDGPTSVTPSPSAQVLPTEGRAVLADIIVNPIPSNYGLITWNGSTLTVS